MKVVYGCIFAGLIALSACSDSKKPNPETPIVGADRDAQGCIASAGYQWCSKTNQCERPWVLAKEHDFENSAEAFQQFCANSTTRPD